MAHPVLVPANPPPRAPPGDRWLGRGPPPDARDGGGLRDRLRANGAPPSPIDQPAQKSAHHRPGNLYGNLRTGFPVGIVNLTSFVMEFRNPMLSRHHARNFLTKLSRAAEPKLRRRLRRDVKLTMPCERSGRSAQTARTVRNRPVSDMAASAARNKFDVSTSARLLKISRAGRPRFRGHGGSIPTSPPLARRARDAPPATRTVSDRPCHRCPRRSPGLGRDLVFRQPGRYRELLSLGLAWAYVLVVARLACPTVA